MSYSLNRQEEPLLKTIAAVAVDLPSPQNMSYLWSFGSLLAFLLSVQMMTGLFLSMNYTSKAMTAFGVMDTLNRDIWNGWVLRYLHMSGASMFFIFLYSHMGRGMYYSSYYLFKSWLSGSVLLIISMASAFFGYVLPWGQMSYWGATVITKFLSVIPGMGNLLVTWVWGSYSVDSPTLIRFFSLHYLCPLMLLFMVVMHMTYLHEKGSGNPLGVKSSLDKMTFYPYYLSKDLLGFSLMPILLFLVFMAYPWLFMEYQNFIMANSLITPTHIQPEWYFLAAYAVLRAMPKKLGGVLALLMFVAIYILLPFLQKQQMSGLTSNPFFQVFFWLWVAKLMFLTWVGACPVEPPYILLSQMGCFVYFSYFMALPEYFSA